VGLEVKTDPEVPPLPPLTLQQAKNFFITRIARPVLETILPSKE
jgi:hypothetical protein